MAIAIIILHVLSVVAQLYYRRDVQFAIVVAIINVVAKTGGGTFV